MAQCHSFVPIQSVYTPGHRQFGQRANIVVVGHLSANAARPAAVASSHAGLPPPPRGCRDKSERAFCDIGLSVAGGARTAGLLLPLASRDRSPPRARSRSSCLPRNHRRLRPVPRQHTHPPTHTHTALLFGSFPSAPTSQCTSAGRPSHPTQVSPSSASFIAGGFIPHRQPTNQPSVHPSRCVRARPPTAPMVSLCTSVGALCDPVLHLVLVSCVAHSHQRLTDTEVIRRWSIGGGWLAGTGLIHAVGPVLSMSFSRLIASFIARETTDSLSLLSGRSQRAVCHGLAPVVDAAPK